MTTTHNRLISHEARQKRRALAKDITNYTQAALLSCQHGNQWSTTEVWINQLRGCVEALAVLCGQPEDMPS